jgi:hypothetical protein
MPQNGGSDRATNPGSLQDVLAKLLLYEQVTEWTMVAAS